MKRSAAYAVLLLVMAVGVSAQEKQTENTLKLSVGQQPAAGSIKDVAWLAGSWLGTGLGGVSEEVYTHPAGGVMLGMYRVIKDGKPMFYELITLAEDGGSLTMRLKHFNPDLKGWEEKNDSVSFRLVKKEGKRVYFEGLTIERQGKNGVIIYVATGNKDGKVEEAIFQHKRVKM
jgi:hypothetical protein